ncbi:hypothetical protein JVU11DRAFT_8171 [Chiua virens]|nr:hypothetical protein JVU11DRAFT_8171 [Chiua virens]
MILVCHTITSLSQALLLWTWQLQTHHQLRGPIPIGNKATKPGCVTWLEMDLRAHMFGAVRNDRDGFVDAFIRELRARPDLFQVVLRSDTAPGRQVEMFGSGASNNQALPAFRERQFEAPPSWRPFPPSVPSSANDEWKITLSAIDVLYVSNDEFTGYLNNKAQSRQAQFFRFKTFPVTYFVILDTVPFRNKSVLARNIAWAALRAGGYAEGEYTVHKYAVAADKLVEKCAMERLEFTPEEMKWKLPRMQDQMS